MTVATRRAATRRAAVHVSVTEQDTGIVIRVAGRLDRAGHDLLRGVLDHVIDRPVDIVWLDVRAVTRFDAVTLALLGHSKRVLRDAGITMNVVAPPYVDTELREVPDEFGDRAVAR